MDGYVRNMAAFSSVLPTRPLRLLIYCLIHAVLDRNALGARLSRMRRFFRMHLGMTSTHAPHSKLSYNINHFATHKHICIITMS
jgi:hypothetical protein